MTHPVKSFGAAALGIVLGIVLPPRPRPFIGIADPSGRGGHQIIVYGGESWLTAGHARPSGRIARYALDTFTPEHRPLQARHRQHERRPVRGLDRLPNIFTRPRLLRGLRTRAARSPTPKSTATADCGAPLSYARRVHREPLAGNPLAVVLDADGLDDARMQAIAREFNLSETVFVLEPQGPRQHGADPDLYARARTAVRRPPDGRRGGLIAPSARAGDLLAAQDLRIVLEEQVGDVVCVARRRQRPGARRRISTCRGCPSASRAGAAVGRDRRRARARARGHRLRTA